MGSKRMGRIGMGRMAALLSAAVIAGGTENTGAEAALKVSGYAWTQYQNGLTPMYKGLANFDYNPFFQAGGLLFLNNQPTENWALNVSLGVGYGNSAIIKTLRDSSGGVVGNTNPNSISLGMGAFLY